MFRDIDIFVWTCRYFTFPLISRGSSPNTEISPICYSHRCWRRLGRHFLIFAEIKNSTQWTLIVAKDYNVKQKHKNISFHTTRVVSNLSRNDNINTIFFSQNIYYSLPAKKKTKLNSAYSQELSSTRLLSVYNFEWSTPLTKFSPNLLHCPSPWSGDVITRRHTVEMSEQYRDQLAKAIYGRLFGYLVNSANDYLQGQDDGLG